MTFLLALMLTLAWLVARKQFNLAWPCNHIMELTLGSGMYYSSAPELGMNAETISRPLIGYQPPNSQTYYLKLTLWSSLSASPNKN